MTNLPALIIMYACIQMLFGLGSAAAFIFVIWPAIREQRAVGKKFSNFLDFYNSFKDKEL